VVAAQVGLASSPAGLDPASLLTPPVAMPGMGGPRATRRLIPLEEILSSHGYPAGFPQNSEQLRLLYDETMAMIRAQVLVRDRQQSCMLSSGCGRCWKYRHRETVLSGHVQPPAGSNSATAASC
jgi:hypothetical protein